MEDRVELEFVAFVRTVVRVVPVYHSLVVFSVDLPACKAEDFAVVWVVEDEEAGFWFTHFCLFRL
jgi:hypothetical protein